MLGGIDGVTFLLLGEPAIPDGWFPGNDYFDAEVEHVAKASVDWSHVKDVFTVGPWQLGLVIDSREIPAGAMTRLQALIERFGRPVYLRPDLMAAAREEEPINLTQGRGARGGSGRR